MKLASLVVGIGIITSLLARAEEKATGWGGGIGYTYEHASVASMPLYIRNVPIHPDDGGGYGPPINREHYSVQHGLELVVGYIKQYDLESVTLRAGGGFKWLLLSAADGSSDDQNYMGSGRGEDSALTYVTMKRLGVVPAFSAVGDVFLAWTPTLKFELGPNGGRFKNLFVGTEVSYHSYYAITGWDRYDRLEEDQSWALAHMIPVRVYLMYRNPYSQFGFSLGAQFQPYFTTQHGKDAKFEADTVGFYTGVSYRF